MSEMAPPNRNLTETSPANVASLLVGAGGFEPPTSRLPNVGECPQNTQPQGAESSVSPPATPEAPAKRQRDTETFTETSRGALRQRALEIIVLRRSGATLQQIGDLYGISRERVRQLLVHEVSGADKRPPLFGGRHTDPLRVVALHRSGVSGRAIARQLGHSPDTVSHLLCALGFGRRTRTAQDWLAELQARARELGHSPRFIELRPGMSWMLRRHYGTLANAQIAAGLEVTDRYGCRKRNRRGVTRQRVLRLRARYPRMSQSEIGRRLGLSSEGVGRMLPRTDWTRKG